MTTLAFPDLSNWEPNLHIQPATVAVIAKATEGTYYQDKSYGRFKAEASTEGSLFSGYHFLKSDEDAGAQAAYYHAFAGATPCMLDVETEGASKPTVDEVLAFAARLRELGGRAWAVYFPKWYWEQVGGDLSRLTAAGLVLVSSDYAAYSDTGPGWAPYGGATPGIWQWTDAQPYGGGSCDFNAFKGTVAELAERINGAPAPAPYPAPEPTVSLHIVQMCAREDPGRPQGQTTNSVEVMPVQSALVAEGLLSANDRRWGRGAFGSMTVAAYKGWQERLGYSGLAADGIPGQESLTKLGAKHGFHVVA